MKRFTYSSNGFSFLIFDFNDSLIPEEKLRDIKDFLIKELDFYKLSEGLFIAKSVDPLRLRGFSIIKDSLLEHGLISSENEIEYFYASTLCTSNNSSLHDWMLGVGATLKENI